MKMLKWLLKGLIGRLYRVEVRGLEHYRAAGDRVLIVANHTSFLDALLLALFLPDRLTFAVNTHIARRWWVRPFLKLVEAFPMDPNNPLSIKSLVAHLKEDRKAVIFPEGRITVTGSLMKVYPGTGLVAERSGAMVLPVRIDGAQYTPFSRLRGQVRLRWFPSITLTLLPPRRLEIPEQARGRDRRTHAGQALAELMTEMVFTTTRYRTSLYQKLLDARKVHGGDHVVAEDIQRAPLTYDALVTRANVLGRAVARHTEPGERVGVLLPNAVSNLALFFALQAKGRVPAMLNYTLGAKALRSAVETAQLRTVYTSRRFVELANLQDPIAAIEEGAQVIYLEDLAGRIGWFDKLAGWFAARSDNAPAIDPDSAAVVLFTSGSEGAPKGVVLSHANLLANRAQLGALLDFRSSDVVLNALPMFHSFGLTAGTLLPVCSGMKVFFYPSPLHYRVVPEVAYDVNATVLFGTNTFLAGYAAHAHPYDFYSLRYVFAGAEKLQQETRRVWAERFGLRIFEGYGATETAPVIAANTVMAYRAGSVGRLMPGIEARLEPVAGVARGGRLSVRGPNVMRGYLLADEPGVLRPPATDLGEGWYDTGDIVEIDEEGYLWILGRAKRFAKVAGEMVSLTAVEELAARTWPGVPHAVVTLPDAQKGERLVLVTEKADAGRAELLARAKEEGVGEINVPRTLLPVASIPLLGTGKIDYPAVSALVAGEVAA